MVKTMDKKHLLELTVYKIILENEWIMARNLSTKISDVSINFKNNPTMFWSYVKKTTNKPGDVSTLGYNYGQLITSDITKAKLLNNYFSSVFVKDTYIYIYN